MSGTAVSLGAVLLPVVLFTLSGVALANTWESRKNKIKAFFMLVLTVGLFGGGYYFLTTGKTIGNVRGNLQALRAPPPPGAMGPLGNAPAVGVPPMMVSR
jgi:hypothetical protein